MSAVSVLHPQARPALEQEHQLIGGALNLRPTQGDFAVIGLTGDEFSIAPYQRIWKHVLRSVEAGRPVSWQSVASKAASSGQFNDYAGNLTKDLERLAETSTLDLPNFRLVGTQFKNLIVGRATAAALRQVAARIEAQGLDPAREAGSLSGLERELLRRGIQLRKLSHAQQRLLEHWDENAATGKSDLIPTGIQALDDVIGGLPKRVVCLFAADPGVGKTAFVNSMFHSMLLRNEGLTAGLVGLEDGVGHVPERLLARRTGWLLRDIGNKKLIQNAERDEAAELQLAAAADYELLERVWSWEARGIDDDELISVIWQMAERGCAFIGIDNFNKIRIKGAFGEQPHERTQRFSERLSEAADKANVCIGLIVHNSKASGRPGEKRGVQGGEALDRDARFRIDFTDKGDELRGTITKANKLCRPGTVIAFKRQATAGLIDPLVGGTVNVEQEKREEEEAKEVKNLNRSLRTELKRKAARDQLKAELEAAKPKPVEPSPQAALDLPEAPNARE